MNHKQLLSKTKKQISQFKKSRNPKDPYPQPVKDAIVKLSAHMSGNAIAQSLEISTSFVCKTIRSAECLDPKIPDSTSSQRVDSVSELQLLDITDELKKVVKEDRLNNHFNSALSMRFSTNSGIVIEIFS